jgi:cell division protein FtsN
MAKDYKHRAQRGKPSRRDSGSTGKWLAAGLLIVLFVAFLGFLRSTAPPDQGRAQTQSVEIPSKTAKTKSLPIKKSEPTKALPAKKKQAEKPPPSAPRFDFYTILPKKEVVIPEHEIKTRKREEKLGKAKAHSYSLQAGSFRNLADADKRKAQLALLGIEARIETALVNGKQWNRVKIGPYSSMNQVDKVRSQLRQNHIDVVVINNKP